MDITKVLLSHLHKDHAGGVGKFDELLNRTFLSFPNAVYYINKQEMMFAETGNNPSYKPEKIMALHNSDNVVLLDDKGIIDGYISYELTAAHSKFHQVFWIEQEGQKVFFGADDAPQLQQMKSKFIAKYDFDGRKSMQLRTKWWEQGKQEHWTILFYHDIKSPSVDL